MGMVARCDSVSEVASRNLQSAACARTDEEFSYSVRGNLSDLALSLWARLAVIPCHMETLDRGYPKYISVR